MNLIAAKLNRGKAWLHWGVLACLLAIALLCPALCVPMALLLSLAMGPAAVSVGLWYALALMLVPFAGLLLSLQSPLLAMCTLSFSALSLLVNSMAIRRRISFNASVLARIGALLLSLLFLCMYLISRVGYNLFAGIAQTLVSWFTTLPETDQKLMFLLRHGVIKLPTRFQTAGVLMLSDIGIFTDGTRDELLRVLRLDLADWLRTAIPAFVMSASIAGGVLSALFTARARVRAAGGSLLAAPSFQTLHLPRKYRGYMLAMALGGALLTLMEGSIPQLMSTLLLQTLLAVYRLLGAAVLTFLLCRRRPERGKWYYALAALLYLVLPTALFLIGLLDSFINLRAASVYHQEEE